jgi:hypothetical protein
MQATTIPVTVTAETETFLHDHGMERPFGEMLEHTRLTVPNLEGIEVSLFTDPENPVEHRVAIRAEVARDWHPEDHTHDNWVEWFIRAFPPHVAQYFGLEVIYRRG